jgi:hypothetical protein
MAVEITAVHLQDGNGHEHITSVRWRNAADGTAGEDTKASMVDWLRKPGSGAYVGGGANRAAVGIVDVAPPYLRTHADGNWTNNLLSLPRY